MTYRQGPKFQNETTLSGYAVSVQTAADLVGGCFFDPSVYSDAGREVYFRCMVSSSDASMTVHVQLYGLTDGTQICDLTTTSVTPVLLSQALTIGTVGPNQIPDASKAYEVRIWVALGTGAESVVLHGANFDVTFV